MRAISRDAVPGVVRQISRKDVCCGPSEEKDMDIRRKCSTYRKYSRFLLHVVCVSTAFIIVTSAVARGAPTASDAMQHARHKINFSSGTRTCNDQVVDMIRVFTSDRYKLTAEKSFRLAVLQGDAKRLDELHKTFPAAGENSMLWGSRQERLETLQMALDDAALANRPTMIEQLTKYGADPNFITQRPMVPAIMVAAGCGNVSAMDLLYKLGADLSLPAFSNPPSNTARNAIEVAVAARQNAAVLWLLNHGVVVCGGHEQQRVAFFMKHPYAKGELSENVVKKLECKNVPGATNQ